MTVHIPFFPHEGPLITLCCVYYMSIYVYAFIYRYALLLIHLIYYLQKDLNPLDPLLAFCDTNHCIIIFHLHNFGYEMYNLEM